MKNISSIFGFYFVVKLLGQMGWPRRRSLFNSEAVINCAILDGAIEQLIDWSASIGAYRPDLALQIIATMFRENDWDSENSLNILTVVSDLKKMWEGKENDNPRKMFYLVKFAKYKDVISTKDLKSKENMGLLEQYCLESIIWGLINPDSFKIYFETKETEQRDKLPEYKKAGLKVDSIPTLDQYLKEVEEILRDYEQEVRPLLPIPQRLIKDALSLGIKVNN